MEWKVPDSLEAEVCRRIGLDPTAVLVLLGYSQKEIKKSLEEESV